MSDDYKVGMTFCTVIVTLFYIIVYSMEMEERAERKREQRFKDIAKL